MRLTKCQEHALMFLYFWHLFHEESDLEYWWSEDCQMKGRTVRSMLKHGLFRTFWGREINLTDAGHDLAVKLWSKNDKYRPLFLQMNSIYGDGAP